MYSLVRPNKCQRDVQNSAVIPLTCSTRTIPVLDYYLHLHANVILKVSVPTSTTGRYSIGIMGYPIHPYSGTWYPVEPYSDTEYFVQLYSILNCII